MILSTATNIFKECCVTDVSLLSKVIYDTDLFFKWLKAQIKLNGKGLRG